MAIQPCFDARGPQPFPGGDQEHPERFRIQQGQPVHRHQRGMQVVSSVGQRDQILGNVCGRPPPRSGATIVCPSLDTYGAVSMTFNIVRCLSKFSLLSTCLAVLITTMRWHGLPSPGLLGRGPGRRGHVPLRRCVLSLRIIVAVPGYRKGAHWRDWRRSNCRGRVAAIVPGNPAFGWFSRGREAIRG